MNTHTEPSPEQKSKSLAPESLQKKGIGLGGGISFIDNRPENIPHKNIQTLVNNSAQVLQQKSIQAMVDSRYPKPEVRLKAQLPAPVVQQKSSNTVIQRRKIDDVSLMSDINDTVLAVGGVQFLSVLSVLQRLAANFETPLPDDATTETARVLLSNDTNRVIDNEDFAFIRNEVIARGSAWLAGPKAALITQMNEQIARYTNRNTTIGRIGTQIVGLLYRWPDATYANIRVTVGLPETVAPLNGFLATIQGLTNPLQYQGLKNDCDNLKQRLDNLEVSATARANAVNTNTFLAYNGQVLHTNATVGSLIRNDFAAGKISVGTRRRDYNSSYDRDERRAFGISYNLENTPYVVHTHYKGNGTILVAVSIKLANNEYGAAVIRFNQFTDETINHILQSINRQPENPRNVAQARQDARDGTAPWRNGSSEEVW